MNLWIRTQDRAGILKCEKLYIQVLNGEFCILNENEFPLGIYKTRGKALEVLDEIQSFLENNYISIDDMPSHSNSPYPGYYPTHISTTYRKKVFKMPKE